MMIRSAWYQVAMYGALTLLQKGMGFILLPITTRYLSVTEYGTLELLVLTLALASLFEISSGALPKLAADKNNTAQSLLSSAVKLSCVYGLVVAGLCLVFILLNPFDIYLLVNWQQAAMLAICVWLMMVLYPLQIWLRIQNRAGHYCFVVASQTLLQAAITVYGLNAGWGINGILLASLCGHLCALIIALIFLQKQWYRPWSTAVVSKIVSYQSRLVGASLALFFMYGLDRIFISHWLGAETLAQYGIMLKLTEVVAVCFAVFEMWWGPKRFLLAQSDNGKQQIVKVHQAVLTLLLAAVVMVSLTAKPVLHWLLPTSYLQGLHWLPALLVMLACRLATSIFDFGCYTQAKPVWLTRINAGYAITALILYVFTVPKWGVNGLLWANIFIYASRLLVFGWLSQRILPLRYRFAGMGLLAAITLVMLIANTLLPLWYSLAIALLWLVAAHQLLCRQSTESKQLLFSLRMR